ncbi:MAG: hypothetical protein AB1Z98_09390 [Nannocystaceae bacterium]
MKISTLSLHALLGAAGLCLASSACIITTSGSDDDDDGDSATDDVTAPDDTGLPPGGTTGVTSVGPDDTGDPDTGGPMGECTENLVLDPGFEAGTPNPSWTEASALFGTPICDSSCTEEPGAEPFAGSWWVWLGGDPEQPETASVSQTITIPPDTAFLSFRFQIRSAAGTGDDVFSVVLDGDTVFMATDLDMADFSDYTEVELDVSPWADGGSYELSIEGDLTGNGLTSFFVDEVSLVSCSESMGTDTGETEGQDTTAGGTDDTGGTSSGGTDGSSSDSGASSTGGSGSTG